MKSRFLAIVALTAVGVVICSPNAKAGLTQNGISVNGISANGLAVNGISANGLAVNGGNLNGVRMNGISANGVRMNGGDLNGANLNGHKMNGQEGQNMAVTISQQTGMVLSSPEFTEIQVEEGRLVGVK